MELRRALLDGGFAVLGPAPTVGSALALLEEERPDCAVLDVSLHGEAVMPVAHLPAVVKVPFVLANAYGGSDLQDALPTRALNLGKPADPERLVEAIRMLVAG